MRTEAQIQASRANGRRSHGPVTPEGKARSSQNAYRHGLLAQTVVLAHENKESFQQYIDQHIDRFSPADEVEMNVIEEAVGAAWRERRCADLLNIAMDTSIADVEPSGDGRRDLLRAFNNLAAGPSVKLLQRYETRYHLMYHRCINTLIKLQKSRPTPPPEVVPSPSSERNEPEPTVPKEPEPSVPNEPEDPVVPIGVQLRSSVANNVVPNEPKTPLLRTFPHFDV